MVTKMRLELEDDTAPAFNSAIKNAEKAEKAIEGLADTMSESEAAAKLMARGFSESEVAAMGFEEKLANVRHELRNVGGTDADAAIREIEDRFREAKEALDKLEAEAEEAAHAIDHIGDEAGQSADQLNRMDSATNKAAAGNSSFVEGMAKLWALKETFMKLAQGVVYLESQGNPAATKMVEKFKELQSTLVRLAETEHFQHMMDGVTGSMGLLDDALSGIAGKTGEVESGFGAALRTAQEYTSMIGIATAELVGIVGAGTAETNLKMIEERQERIKNHDAIMAQKKQEALIAKQTSDVAKIESDLARSRAAEEYQETVKKIESADELEAKQKAELERMRVMAREGKATAEEQQDGARRVAMLEARKTELAAKEEQRREDQRKRSAEIEEEMRREEMELVKKEAADKAKIQADLQAGLAAEREEARQKELSETEAHIQKLTDAVRKSHDEQGGPTLNMEEIGGGVASRERAAKHLVKQNADRAEQSVKEDFESQYGRGEDGKFKAGWGRSEREVQALYQKEVASARKTAARETKQDINSGKADDKLAEIQGDFAKGFIDQQASQRDLSKNSVLAMKKAVDVSVKMKQDQDQLATEVQEIQSVLADLGNSTGRQQRQRKRS